MNDRNTIDNNQIAFWNEEGGERWTENIEHVEAMIRPLNEHLFARLAPHPGARVLDVGCGGGITSAALAEAVGAEGEVLGVDVSEIILAVARRRYSGVANLHFRHGDATELPLDTGAFDLITSRFGVMFFHDPVAAFTNLRTALKPGGRLVFMCWRAMKENPWMACPAGAAFQILPPPEAPDPEAPGPFSFAQRERVERILQASGFTGVNLEPIDQTLNLGALQPAADFLTRMGPPAAALKGASEAVRIAVVDAVRKTLAEFETGDGVQMAGATWIVSAGG